MAPITYTQLSQIAPGLPNASAPVVDCFNKTQASVNSIDKEQASTALAQLLGLSNGANVGRGKSIIATTEVRSNVAYGTLTTPDQVTGIVLPTDGLIFVTYSAVWQESVNNQAAAAIFVGATQLKKATSTAAAPSVQEASLGAGAGAVDKPLVTHTQGLIGLGENTTAYTGDVTTGQTVGWQSGVSGTAIGGPCTIFAAAGTYTVSVQFKAASGSVTAKNRSLRVWTISF